MTHVDPLVFMMNLKYYLKEETRSKVDGVRKQLLLCFCPVNYLRITYLLLITATENCLKALKVKLWLSYELYACRQEKYYKNMEGVESLAVSDWMKR